jgi:hypothetical protein
MRPGMMMGGKVVMAPSRVEPAEQPGVSWINKCFVAVNNGLRDDVLAYDEDSGVAMVQPEFGDPQMILGTVRATPRLIRA